MTTKSAVREHIEQQAEWAWAAGLFEGEGSISSREYGYTVCMSMTDEDVVRNFHRVIGCGHVYGPYRYSGIGREHHAQYWRWAVSDKAGIERFIDRVYCWLGPRRQRQLDPAKEHVGKITGKRSSLFDN